jgi:large conductance mechanosensitive channel
MKKEKIQKEKKSIIQEFREFALKGNVVDLAVGVVVGAAFNGIVNSLVKDIITPLVGFLTSGANFVGFKYQFGSTPEEAIRYGDFIQAIINFLIIAFTVFIVVKIINKIRTPRPEEEASPAPTETEVLVEIRDLLREK